MNSVILENHQNDLTTTLKHDYDLVFTSEQNIVNKLILFKTFSSKKGDISKRNFYIRVENGIIDQYRQEFNCVWEFKCVCTFIVR